MYRSVFVLCTLLMFSPAAGFGASGANEAGAGERLIEAAQLEDVAIVRQLLASGVAVDFKSRYGATALFFAVDKGNLEILNLLLENGAEVDVMDTFYRATPVTWALFSAAESPVHKEIVLLLLERGSSAAPEVLSSGARTGDLDLVRGAVETGSIEPLALRSALNRAQQEGHDEIVEYLASRVPEEPAGEAPGIPLEVLATYVGNYKNADIGMIAKVFVEEETLKIQAEGQPVLDLASTGERS